MYSYVIVPFSRGIENNPFLGRLASSVRRVVDTTRIPAAGPFPAGNSRFRSFVPPQSLSHSRRLPRCAESNSGERGRRHFRFSTSDPDACCMTNPGSCCESKLWTKNRSDCHADFIGGNWIIPSQKTKCPLRAAEPAPPAATPWPARTRATPSQSQIYRRILLPHLSKIPISQGAGRTKLRHTPRRTKGTIHGVRLEVNRFD
jgi:hypothetical protein